MATTKTTKTMSFTQAIIEAPRRFLKTFPRRPMKQLLTAAIATAALSLPNSADAETIAGTMHYGSFSSFAHCLKGARDTLTGMHEDSPNFFKTSKEKINHNKERYRIWIMFRSTGEVHGNIECNGNKMELYIYDN